MLVRYLLKCLNLCESAADIMVHCWACGFGIKQTLDTLATEGQFTTTKETTVLKAFELLDRHLKNSELTRIMHQYGSSTQ